MHAEPNILGLALLTSRKTHIMTKRAFPCFMHALQPCLSEENLSTYCKHKHSVALLDVIKKCAKKKKSDVFLTPFLSSSVSVLEPR